MAGTLRLQNPITTLRYGVQPSWTPITEGVAGDRDPKWMLAWPP